MLVVIPSDLTTFKILSKAVLAAPEEARFAGFHPSARTIGARSRSPAARRAAHELIDHVVRGGNAALIPVYAHGALGLFNKSVTQRGVGTSYYDEISIKETRTNHRKLDS